MAYTMYTPLNVWLDPASVTDVVAYIQHYLSENTIYSEEEIETLIHDYLEAHPELIGGVQSVNGKTGTVVLTASDINTANNVTIESVLASLSSQISSIASSVATNMSNITNLTGRVTTAETDISNLKSSLNGSYSLVDSIISGSYNSYGGVVTNPKRIRTQGFITLTSNDEIVFKPSSRFKSILYGTFTENGVFVGDSPWLEGEQHITVSETSKIIIIFKSTPETDILPNEFDAELVFYNIIGKSSLQLNDIEYSITFDSMQDGMISTNGEVSNLAGYKHTPFIYVPLIDGGEISVSSTIIGNASLAFYDIHKNLIKTVNGSNISEYGSVVSQFVTNRILEAPKNTTYIRATIGTTYGNVSQFKLICTSLKNVYSVLDNRDILSLNINESMIVNAGANYGHHSNGVSNVDKRFTALLTTDVHGDSTALERAVEYLNLMPCFDCGITLGDLQADTFSDNDGLWYTNDISESNKNWLTLVGNHDFGIGSKVDETGTVAQVYEKYIQPNLIYAGTIVDSGKCYYYKDFSNYKLRLICLNPYDVNNYSTDGSGNYIVNRYTEYYSQTQIDWLISALNGVPTDYQVIILSHSAPAATTKDENIKFNNREIGLPNECTQTDLITDIVQAWIMGQTLNNTYSSTNTNLDDVTVSADFTSRGSGVFVCFLTGHQHIDFVGHITKYTNQVILSFSSTCTDMYQNGGRIDLPRADNTKAEDCITSFSVDTTNKNIYIVRIGSSMSKWFDRREPSVITY